MIFIQKQVLLLLTLLFGSGEPMLENLKSVLLTGGFTPWTPRGCHPCTPLRARVGQRLIAW